VSAAAIRPARAADGGWTLELVATLPGRRRRG